MIFDMDVKKVAVITDSIDRIKITDKMITSDGMVNSVEIVASAESDVRVLREPNEIRHQDSQQRIYDVFAKDKTTYQNTLEKRQIYLAPSSNSKETTQAIVWRLSMLQTRVEELKDRLLTERSKVFVGNL